MMDWIDDTDCIVVYLISDLESVLFPDVTFLQIINLRLVISHFLFAVTFQLLKLCHQLLLLLSELLQGVKFLGEDLHQTYVVSQCHSIIVSQCLTIISPSRSSLVLVYSALSSASCLS